MTNDELWQAALGEIELNVSRPNFVTWFKNTYVSVHENGEVVVSVPNGFTKEWLENKYNKFVLKALRNVSPEVKDVRYVIGPYTPPARARRIELPETDEVLAQEGQLEFGDLGETQLNVASLNQKYSFESFIIGSSNELAHAAATAVSRHPGEMYNPLFIYGGVGLGKTHLVQAIGNELLRTSPQLRVRYVPSEKFTSDLINAIKGKVVEEFKPVYRTADVLIIDDIQFLAGKEKTQEEFFHTFNDLYTRNKQIIISSDRPPKAIPTLEERLRSRFEGGMIADIGFPEFEMRMAILKKRCEERKLPVSDEVLQYTATKIQRNIRELEGALNKIMAYARLNNTLPTLRVAEKILSSLIHQPKRLVTTRDVMRVVCEFYDIRVEEMVTQCRRREIVKPRQIIMFILREDLKSSYPAIGAKLGNRDHTTVMYACEKITKELDHDMSLQEELRLIRERLYTGLT